MNIRKEQRMFFMFQPQIQVLLSAYNGERYIEEQLDSLLIQEGVQLELLIRDDGSSDSTASIVHEYEAKNPGRITCFQESNIGAKASFFKLINYSSDEMDYYAFCDQDDVWEKGKLQRAVAVLEQKDGSVPLMYCSATKMVDSSLNYLNTWPNPPIQPLSLYNSAVENVAVGCTMVMNKPAMKLIKDHLPKTPANIIMHDWWVYMVVSAFGQVVFDATPHIMYRQHGGNVLGGQTESGLERWRKRAKRFLNGQHHFILSSQVRQFYLAYQDMLPTDLKHDLFIFLETLDKSLINRLSYAFHLPFYRQSTLDNLILKLIYVMKKV